MRKNGSGRAALAAIGAAAGTAFASGRALAGFYAQLGGLSWLAVGLSAAVFGMLTGLCAKHAARFGAGSLAELCRRGLSRGACRAVGRGYWRMSHVTSHIFGELPESPVFIGEARRVGGGECHMSHVTFLVFNFEKRKD